LGNAAEAAETAVEGVAKLDSHTLRADARRGRPFGEPECPLEAIVPEDAPPDNWEPFAKITYAYIDADQINSLVGGYTPEHAVRNSPLEVR
jgi:hypothetical protein